MTHRDNMLRCLEKVNLLTAQIDDWEQKTREVVITKHAATIDRLKDPLDREHVILFHVGRILSKKLVFQKMVKARDRNIVLVQMYGLVNLVEQTSPTYPHD